MRERFLLQRMLAAKGFHSGLRDMLLDRGWCKRAGIESEYTDEEVQKLREEVREEVLERYLIKGRDRFPPEKVEKAVRQQTEMTQHYMESYCRIWFDQGQRWWLIQDIPIIFDYENDLRKLPPQLRSKADAVQRLRRSQKR